MLDELRSAIEREDFAGALVVALEWWRETRSPELADLVDLLGARCTLPAPPRREVQAWWMLNAATYNPVAVTALVAHAADRAGRSERKWPVIRAWHADNPVLARLVEPYAAYIEDKPYMMDRTNCVERLAGMVAWPDDPRAAKIYASWFVEGAVNWSGGPLGEARRSFYELLAERMIALADVRVDELLASAVVEPRGKSAEVRGLQSELARHVIASVARHAATLDGGAGTQISRWREQLAVASVRDPVEEDALWDEVERSPDDLGARMVLGDFLLEHGDPRGELFALQRKTGSYFEIKALREQHWTTWLGDLGLLLDPDGCEFANGMLEIIRVGHSATPDWVYEDSSRVRGHRELACVHTVRPSGSLPPAAFVDFLLALERLPRCVGISHAIAAAMLARAPWPFAKLEFDHNRLGGYNRPPLAATLELGARVVPDITSLWVRVRKSDIAQACACVPQLPGWFGKLAHVVLESHDWRWEGTKPADFAQAPLYPP